MTDQTIFNQLKQLLAELTGNSKAEIFAKSDLLDHLNVDPEQDFPVIIDQINQTFEIDLEADKIEKEYAVIGITVGRLAELIKEEKELG
ncbi:MAG: hypothetical protein GF390_03255 [Candidatus Pacebacteria bacterium]|nr:hypothetical protein [Candidatus Paceibacterota bacterium]